MITLNTVSKEDARRVEIICGGVVDRAAGVASYPLQGQWLPTNDKRVS